MPSIPAYRPGSDSESVSQSEAATKHPKLELEVADGHGPVGESRQPRPRPPRPALQPISVDLFNPTRRTSLKAAMVNKQDEWELGKTADSLQGERERKRERERTDIGY